MYQRILDFWFDEANKPFWFRKSEEFDQAIRQRFFSLWRQAARGELAEWRESMRGRLAEIIVLDQFSRNLHRNHADAFAQDTVALVLAQEAARLPEFAGLSENERHMLLMPFMHSESAVIHQQAVALFEKFTNEYALDFELKHKVIIDRFGRYPHRNAVLGRENTPEENEFLQHPDSSF